MRAIMFIIVFVKMLKELSGSATRLGKISMCQSVMSSDSEGSAPSIMSKIMGLILETS